MEVLFPEYFQSISRIFPYHGKHFHTMELDKTMETGFSNLVLQYFHCISSILWERSNFSSVTVKHCLSLDNVRLNGPLLSHGSNYLTRVRATAADRRRLNVTPIVKLQFSKVVFIFVTSFLRGKKYFSLRSFPF